LEDINDGKKGGDMKVARTKHDASGPEYSHQGKAESKKGKQDTSCSQAKQVAKKSRKAKTFKGDVLDWGAVCWREGVGVVTRSRTRAALKKGKKEEKRDKKKKRTELKKKDRNLHGRGTEKGGGSKKLWILKETSGLTA